MVWSRHIDECIEKILVGCGNQAKIRIIGGCHRSPPKWVSVTFFPVSLACPTPGATIHYTLDGTDPRQPQGAVLTNALVYSGPIPIRSNIVIVARARNPNQHQTGGPPSSTPWSSPVTAKFVVTPR